MYWQTWYSVIAVGHIDGSHRAAGPGHNDRPLDAPRPISNADMLTEPMICLSGRCQDGKTASPARAVTLSGYMCPDLVGTVCELQCACSQVPPVTA